jgi:hypothetical protein
MASGSPCTRYTGVAISEIAVAVEQATLVRVGRQAADGVDFLGDLDLFDSQADSPRA